MTGKEIYTVTLKNVRGTWKKDIHGILHLNDFLDEIAEDEWVELVEVQIKD